MSTKVRLLHDTITIPTGAVAVTQSASDNTTKVATTAYVTTAIANLADSAPSTLNTLNELAAALGDDANFSTTVTNSIAAKLPLAGGALTGALTSTSSITAASGGNEIQIGTDGNIEITRTAGGAYIDFKDSTGEDYDQRIQATSTGLSFSGAITSSGYGVFTNGDIDPDSFTSYAGGFGNIADGGGWAARGLFVHGGGTGDAAAIAHNGSNLYFGIQNGSAANSMSTWMEVSPAKAVTFAGSSLVTLPGTVSSPHFSTSSNINSSGSGGVFIPNGKRIGFDQTGTRSWTQYAAGGNLLFASGDGNGAIQANNFTASVSYKVGTTTVIDSSRNLSNIGTISSGAITSSGAIAGNRVDSSSSFELPSSGFVDWANGDARIIEGLTNNYSLSFQTYDGSNLTTALRLDGNNAATFSGTISSGAITTSAALQVQHSGTNNISLSPTSTGGVINARNSSGTSVVVMDGRGTPFIDVTGNLKTGGTIRMDSSGNLTNIGTISSGNITATKMYINNGTTYGVGIVNLASARFDTVDSGVSTDPLELCYYNGNGVRIGPNGGDQYLSAGSIQITGTTVIDSSRNLTNIGNISVSGTVDGRDVAADGSKLDGIAAGANNITNTNQLTNGAGFITQSHTTIGGVSTGRYLKPGAGDSVGGWWIDAARNGSGTSPYLYFSHESGYGMHLNTYNTSAGVYAMELHNNSIQTFAVYNNGQIKVGGNNFVDASRNIDAGSIKTDNYDDSGGTFLFKKGSGSGLTRHLNLADTTADPAAVTTSNNPTGISWGQRSDNNGYYMLGLKGQYNNGLSNHSRLAVGWHTGVEIGGAASYGGTRFFNDSPFVSTTELMSIGKGDGHVRITNNLFANGDIYGKSVNNAYSSIYRIGGVFFTWDSDTYGTNTHHCIRSTDGDAFGDHITLNSFGNVRINFDSNGNGTNYFRIGHHTTGTGGVLLTIDESGNATFAGNVTAYSDIKLKENIVNIDNALDKICSMRGIYYNMIEDTTKSRRIGLVAQEVEKVLPEVVIEANPEEDKENILSVDYGNIVALLIEGMKEQQKQIDELKEKLESK